MLLMNGAAIDGMVARQGRLQGDREPEQVSLYRSNLQRSYSWSRGFPSTVEPVAAALPVAAVLHVPIARLAADSIANKPTSRSSLARCTPGTSAPASRSALLPTGLCGTAHQTLREQLSADAITTPCSGRTPRIAERTPMAGSPPMGAPRAQ